MSTQAQHMGHGLPWDHPQFEFGHPVQLEESPYPLETAPAVRRFPQQHFVPPPFHAPVVTPRGFGSFSFGSGFPRPSTLQSPPFIPRVADVNLALDTSSSSLGTSPPSTHISPVYTPSLNGLEHTPANYQTSPFGSPLEHSISPENSPNPNTVMSNHSLAHAYLPTGPMQFSPPLPLPSRQSELQSHYFNAPYMRPQHTTVPAKRPRLSDDYDDQGDQPDVQEQEPARPKPTGACARCKSLKVRCEFRNDSDTCKRCTSAGQECVIPGRKPRRTPPKREHLLNQIREQAAQIQQLMAKIESLNNPATATIQTRPVEPDMHSTMKSSSESVVPNAEMQNWIAKARVSIREFGGLIPATDPNDLDDHSDDGGSDDESGYATAEDDADQEVLGSPASSKKQAAQTTKLKMIPEEDAPFGLMAVMSIRKGREKSVEPESSEALGVASADFFKTSRLDHMRKKPSNSGVQLPHILARGIVSIKEVDTLFNIYFEKMNPSCSLLDSVLHTPQYVAMRSPFLFTIICGVASRFYEPRPHLYRELMQYGQLAAGTALISGTKNEEMSAAYILMQLYPVPAKKWDEERSWVYLGVAIRIAQDINLNRPVTTKPLNEQNARIILSRQRIWMNCFNLDRSTGTQYGKRPIISNSDYFAAHAENWWRSSPFNIKGFDIHIVVYNAELRLISGFMSKIYGDPSHPIGLDKKLNVAQLASDTDDALRQLGDFWFKRLDEIEEEKTGMAEFRTGLLKMAYAYARLVALSTGLKHAKDGQLDENTFIMRCLEAASDIVNAFVRRLFPTSERKILLRHAPDAQFVFVTFAGAFLVKLLLPKYAKYFTYERRQEIRTLVQEAVDLLGSPEVVVDDKHGPMLFSRFLGGLLATQSVNPDTLSPKSAHSRHMNSSKATSHRAKDPGGPSSPLSYTNGPIPEYYSNIPDSSPQPQFIPFENYSGGHSPSTPEFGLGLQTPDFNQGPAMPVDQELLDSIQFMSDPLWQDTPMPGFSWVNQLNPANSALNINDYIMYEPYATAA